MDSLRKWLYKPRRDDSSHLAQFFYADEALNSVAAELDSFDGRKDPERCTTLVNSLRQCQDKVLTICNRIMDEMIPNERADRNFRVKFPDDVMQDNLAGQLWFGAECLAAGSSIMNRESESGAMRPLARALTKALENVRNLLREAALRSTSYQCMSTLVYDQQTEKLVESLKVFDRLLAEFELAYVSAMVPVKTVMEYEMQQNIIVLFSETLERALKMGVLQQEMVDQYDPALMFTIPRLAIVTGLLIYPNGPLSLHSPQNMSDMFRPFSTLLIKIRELLWTMSDHELLALEKLLCSSDESITTDDIDDMSHIYSFDAEMSLSEKLFETTSEGTWNLDVIPCQCDNSSSSSEPSSNNVSCSDNSVNSRPIPNRNNLSENNDLVVKSADWRSRESTDEPNERRYENNWKSLSSITVSQDFHESNEEEGLPSSLSSCSSCQSTVSAISNSLSSDTSSYNSDCQDEKEVALAMKAAELTNCQEIRAKFRSSGDLVHRLFVCISGVADQLQTNFAGDLRNILKAVFLIHATDKSDCNSSDESNNGSECCERGEEAVVWGEREVESPPEWVPDQEAPLCMSCNSSFTVVRRRHHCRNCGKVFCARCSSNSVPLPRYGHNKPVRVCNKCFIYQVTPFTIDSNIPTAN